MATPQPDTVGVTAAPNEVDMRLQRLSPWGTHRVSGSTWARLYDVPVSTEEW
jgi:hypothetical protein